MGADGGRGPLACRRVPASGRAAGGLARDRDGARGPWRNRRRRAARGAGRLAALPLAARVPVPGGLAGDLAGLDAGGADVEALRRSGDERANGLDVGVPATAGAAVRVRDVVA